VGQCKGKTTAREQAKGGVTGRPSLSRNVRAISGHCCARRRYLFNEQKFRRYGERRTTRSDTGWAWASDGQNGSR